MTPQQYFQRYYELLPKFKNGELAFIELEKEHKKKFKVNKYTTYNSFRKAKSYYFGVY